MTLEDYTEHSLWNIPPLSHTVDAGGKVVLSIHFMLGKHCSGCNNSSDLWFLAKAWDPLLNETLTTHLFLYNEKS